MPNAKAKESVKLIVGWLATNSLVKPCAPPLLHAVQYTRSLYHREVVNFCSPEERVPPKGFELS